MPDINGIAHIQLTVTDMARSIPFYKRLLTGMGLTLVLDNPFGIYAVGGRTGVSISPSEAPYDNERFKQRHPGLHHVCFRARSRPKMWKKFMRLPRKSAQSIVHPPQEDGFAPGYYSVLFEDPDGIRIEANHVPGEGLLAPGRGQVGNANTKWD